MKIHLYDLPAEIKTKADFVLTGSIFSALKKALKNIAGKEDIEKINQAIVKLFSLQNVIENITILNSNKIIDQVEIIMNDLERRLKKYFTNDLKISLYIHISCLIERFVKG